MSTAEIMAAEKRIQREVDAHERTKGNLAAMQRDRDALASCQFAGAANYRRLLVERDEGRRQIKVALEVLVKAQWLYGAPGRGTINALEEVIVALAPELKELDVEERHQRLIGGEE
jgi:hypothetical protein